MTTNRLKTFIRQYSRNIWFSAFYFVCLTACTEEQTVPDKQPTGRDVCITALLPDDTILSKAASPKESFAKDDVIHIYAEYTLSDNSQSTAYACMKFDGAGTWTAFDNTQLEWPWNAKMATFTAYYIPPVTVAGTEIKNNMAMSQTTDNNTLGFSLSNLTEATVVNGTDPMIATYTNVPVESAVHLQFNHLFAKLTFTHLGKDNNSNSALIDREILYLSAENLKDSCIFERKVDANELSHTLETNKSYIGSRTESEGSGGTYAVTFLIPRVEPAGIDLRLMFKDFSPYHLVPIKQALEAGKHYSLDITKLADNYWSDDLKEEAWNKDETVDPFTTDDINKYLQAIRDGQEYRKNNVQILDVYQEVVNGRTTTMVTQLKDVDFDNQSFTPVSISTNIIFQGNGYKIKNLKVQSSIDDSGNQPGKYQALFGKNEGKIKNLIIEGAQAIGTSEAEYVTTLVGLNTGTIEKVKINFNPDDKVTGTANTKNIGGLSAVNEGTITDCTLSGSNIEVSIENGNDKQEYYIGGAIGYNSVMEGTIIQNVRVQVQNSTVQYIGTNGNVMVGGWAGYSEGRLQECSSSMDILLNGAQEAYIGGFAGELYGSLAKCSSTGSLKLTSPDATIFDAGGFTGMAAGVTMNACYASGAIENTASPLTVNALIGGFAGRIVFQGSGHSDLVNCFTISEVPNDAYGFTAKACDIEDGSEPAGEKVNIRNSFSRNKGAGFVGNDGATLTNVHNNGTVPGGSMPITVDELNSDKPDDGLEWTASPALYGTGFPYFIIK